MMDIITANATKFSFDTINMIVPNRLSILIFHRVHANMDTIFPSEPDALRFERLMRFVAKTFNVMSLGKAAEKLAAGTLPPRSLVITFDDGYADNVEVALPILLRHGLVATFFISTGFLDGGRMWNDSVIECLKNTRKLHVNLDEFGLGHLPLTSAEERRNAIESMLQAVKYLSLSERERAIEHLMKLCELSTLPTKLMMRTEQVRELHAVGMECGGHTVKHPILQSLSLDQAYEEIKNGKQHLESIIDSPVEVFAYPNGKPEQDYSAQHTKLVKDIGFRCAVTTAKGAAKVGDNLFQLPRYSPWGASIPIWSIRLLMNQFQQHFETI